ncbi:hypothetical protein R1flu_026555 [Riccia fluitans]|uniref:Retrovirus-related Pol polyprotein from transposon TNT 1-94 n=1 Tax=Riccia fluitans TaxID=41844 RepID=A0ABD1XGA8_9MARC
MEISVSKFLPKFPSEPCGEAHVTASQGEMAKLWHRRLGHMSEKGMEVLRKQDLLFGLKSSKLEFCEHCVFGKHKRSAFSVEIHRSTEVLEYAHSDMWFNLSYPFELWHKRVPDYSKLRVFGCIARDVSFNEARSLKEGEKAQAPDIDKGESHPSGVEGEIIHDINHDTPQGDLPTVVEDVSEPEKHVEEKEGVDRPMGRPQDDDQPESSMKRSSHVKGALERYGVWFPSDQVDEHDNEGDVYMLITEEGEPSSFEEAQNLAEKAEWSMAMRKEMKSLNDNKTWELVELPKGKQVIACRWVYKRKEGSETDEKIFKARLAAKGFTQRKGVDYNEVFAPVAKYSKIRLLLSLGFTRSVEDPCVYLKRVSNEVFGLIILVLYVDDMLLVAKDKSEVEKVKAQLSKEFSMKDLGSTKRILGMEIHRDVKGGRLWLTQGNYTRKVLERFNMLDAKPVGTPLANHFKHQLSAKFCPIDATEKGLISKIPYESVVGSLMYLMMCTRPDIAYALGKAKTLVGFVDSDYAQDLDTRQPTMGYVMILGGGCITWRSVLQKCKTLSTTEVEYVAATVAAKEAIWLGWLTSEMGLSQGCFTLYCDSQSALYLAANQVMSSKIKHIDVRYHFIKQVVFEGKVKLQKVAATLNPADGFTKYIPLESFSSHRAKLQILPMDKEES